MERRTSPSRGEACDHLFEILHDGKRAARISLVEGTVLTVGRGDGADVHLDDGLLSRRHLRVECRAGRVHVIDLGSKNQTFVGDSPIDEVILEPGTVIRFGDCRAYLRSVRAGKPRSLSVSDDGHDRRSELDASDRSSFFSGDHSRGSSRVALEELYRLTEKLLEQTERRSLFRAVERAVLPVVALERFVVATSATEHDECEIEYAWGAGSGQVCLSRTLLESAQRDRKAFVAVIDPDEFEDSVSVRDLGVTSYMVAPFFVDGVCRGFLYGDRSADPELGHEDLQFFQAVAHLTGLALERIEQQACVERDLDRFRTIARRRGGFVAESAIMRNVLVRVERVAALDNPVLLNGETGTGKEVLARMIHDLSSRRRGPFVAFNCALSSPELIESELFGHVSGAFTGASSRRRGRFELAHGGTLFLDEIGDTPPCTQVKLLRALQEGEIWPVGAEAPVSVDLRVISATHQNLSALKRSGEFREDLYYRLSVLPIDLPPLRKRDRDIVAIARSLLPEGIDLEDDAIQALESYPWPGNVRELRNVLEQALFEVRSNRIRRTDLPKLVSREGIRPVVRFLPLTLEQMEAKHIRYTLEVVEGNKQRAAELLGISRSTLYQKLKALGI